MIIYRGKNKDFNKQVIAKAYWLLITLQTRPVEPLESVDFSNN